VRFSAIAEILFQQNAESRRKDTCHWFAIGGSHLFFYVLKFSIKKMDRQRAIKCIRWVTGMGREYPRIGESIAIES